MPLEALPVVVRPPPGKEPLTDKWWFWTAIGTAVFGGMLAATTLGIFFVPSFFVAVCRIMGIGKKDEKAAEEQQVV